MSGGEMRINPETNLAEGSFAIGTFMRDGRSFPAIVLPDGQVIEVGDRFHDTHAIFDEWERSFDILADAAARPAAARHHLKELRALPPLKRPNVLCGGANYKTHVIEMMSTGSAFKATRRPGETDEAFWARNTEIVEKRAREGKPFVFTSLHSSLTGANDDIIIPPVGVEHDWELELTLVVGKARRHVPPERAAECIAGYLIVNDIGTFDVGRRDDVPFFPDWIGKSQPSFKVAGPFIVPKPFFDAIPDVRIHLAVNGKVKQDWPVDDMIFPPEAILSYASSRVNLMPGDLLLTGSPPGNATYHGEGFLKDGDLVESEITGLGRQVNRCVDEVVVPA